eukprot:5218527-Pyramimonas_sp.AAC.1
MYVYCLEGPSNRLSVSRARRPCACQENRGQIPDAQVIITAPDSTPFAFDGQERAQKSEGDNEFLSAMECI